jgi:SAM-dependent methyltransferase
MALIGGALGYRLLKTIAPGGTTQGLDDSNYDSRSKLEMLLGAGVWDRLRDRVVIDFGCGEGHESVEMAQRGARHVIGLDIQERWLAIARGNAERAGVLDRCTFATTTDERADVIVAIDSFEHFDDPAGILDIMRGHLKAGGRVLIAFGPTWYHPYGGHTFSPLPWAHLIFTERALCRWRSDFKHDGAQRFHEVEGGLNGMTIRRFEEIVEASPFRFERFEMMPIRKLKPVANRVTREFTTAMVRAELVPRSSS